MTDRQGTPLVDAERLVDLPPIAPVDDSAAKKPAPSGRELAEGSQDAS